MLPKLQNLSQKYKQNNMDIVRNAPLIWPVKDLQLFVKMRTIIINRFKMIEFMNKFLNLNHFTIHNLQEYQAITRQKSLQEIQTAYIQNISSKHKSTKKFNNITKIK